MCTEATLEEYAISLVLVISCEPVKVESESRNFSEEQRVYRWQLKQASGFPVPIFLPTCIYIGTLPFSLIGNQTVHEDSFKYKYKLS